MEGGPQRHGMDREQPVVVEFENDHFEQVSCFVGADHEQLRRVVVLVQVDDNDRVINDMVDRDVVNVMAPR